jgi:penicillin-binding protein 1A
MAQAYDAFANGGRRVEGHGITRIRTQEGRVIYQRANDVPNQAIQNPSLYYLNQMLRGVVTSGTARSVQIAGRDIAGKTGTTSDYKDAWFVGYTGGFVTAVWVGKDDNSAMRGVTGGAAPAAIWRGFMEAALPRLNVQAIPNGPAVPDGWVPPDPIGDLMGGLGDLFGGQDAPSVDPNQGTPYEEALRAPETPSKPTPSAPARQPNAVVTPPAQNPEPEVAPERRNDPLFF